MDTVLTPTPAPERETPTPERCCQEQEDTENKAESRTGWCSLGMLSVSPQGSCHAGIVDSSKGGVTGNDTEGTLEVNTEGGEIDHCAADQAQSVKSVNENQAAQFVTAMTSWSVEVDGAGGGGGVSVTADVISDTAAMSRRRNTNNNTAASSTTPPPSVDDSARADRSVKLGSDRPEPPQTPDTGLLSSHGAGDDLRETNDVFCASSTTSGTNYCLESCASSQRHSEGCQKRSALIFPELVADVGGCLCTRRSLRQATRQPAVSTPDLFAMLPDLITSHRFLNAEVPTPTVAIILVLFVHFVVPKREFLPWEIRVAFRPPPRKASCNRVALPNP